MTKKSIASTISALALTLISLSAHAIAVSGAGFRPTNPSDVPMIVWAQGAVTSTESNFIYRSVVADMGAMQAGQIDGVVDVVGNGLDELCFVDTREILTGIARTFTFTHAGSASRHAIGISFLHPNVGGIYVSLRCSLSPITGAGQFYIFGAVISQTHN